jgi:hypothetical protein
MNGDWRGGRVWERATSGTFTGPNRIGSPAFFAHMVNPLNFLSFLSLHLFEQVVASATIG